MIVHRLQLLEIEQHTLLYNSVYKKMFEAEVTKTGVDYLQLSFTFKNIQFDEKCFVEVVLYLHQGVKGESEYSRDQFYPPFEKYIRLQPLPSESMFKVLATLHNRNNQLKSTIYTFTKVKDD
jgi:hypothetical protein